MARTQIAKIITKKQIQQEGVQALANRPNLSAQYGKGGLTASELKRWFDNLATLIIDELNSIITKLESPEAGKYIGVDVADKSIDNLGLLIDGLRTGDFANLLKASSSRSGGTLTNLQELLYEALDNRIKKDGDMLEGDVVFQPKQSGSTTSIDNNGVRVSSTDYTVFFALDDNNNIIKFYDGANNKTYEFKVPTNPQASDKDKTFATEGYVNKNAQFPLEIANGYDASNNPVATVNTVTAKINEMLAESPEAFDTLQEISAWLGNHSNDALEMQNRIGILEDSQPKVVRLI
jgi:mRNA-degrading endonuclease RelE of RelBE toxin-antitoxin system